MPEFSAPDVFILKHFEALSPGKVGSFKTCRQDAFAFPFYIGVERERQIPAVKFQLQEKIYVDIPHPL